MAIPRWVFGLSVALNVVALAAFSFYVQRRGGSRYLLERAGLVQAVAMPTPKQSALADAYARSPVQPGEIIFAGDSLIMRAPVCGWFGRIKNFGIPGDISDGLLQRLHTITARQPAKLFVQIGTNDLLRDIPIDEIIANISTLITRVRAESPHTEVVIMSLLPVHQMERRDVDHERKIVTIPKLNAALRHLAGAQGAGFVDMYSAFVDDAGQLKRTLSFDGTHLLPDKYPIYLERIEPYVPTTTGAGALIRQ